MAVFLLRISFHNRPTGNDMLLTGRVYPLTATIKAGDWLVFGEMKLMVRKVEVSDHEGITLTISEGGVENLRRSGVMLTSLYGTEIPIESAALPTE
jgi:hypothetical protein